MYSGITLPDVHGNDSETLTFKSAVAHMTTNTAKSTATLAICDRRSGSDPIGAVNENNQTKISDYCTSLRTITNGTRLLWAQGWPPKEYILLVIRPEQAGTTRVDKVRYTYTRSWKHFHQQGSESGTVDITIHPSR
ncbi:MAG: hypothetical protein JWP74_3498 [Marmoricola sp.]|nr:hypothetical protein [Marmoricola sp.]